MKKIISIVLVSLLLSSITTKADCVRRQLWKWDNGTPGANGGPMTYDYMVENDIHTELECKDPGSKVCKWSDGTPTPKIVVNGTNVTWDEALNNAEYNVSIGINSGYVEGENGSHYSWLYSAGVLQFEMNECTN